MTVMELTGMRRVRQAAARHPQVLDAALGAVLATVGILTVVVGTPEHPARPLTAGDLVAVVVAFGAVAARRLRPLPVLAVTTAATAGHLLLGGAEDQPVLIGALAIVAYTLATRTARRTAWLAAGTSAILLYAATALGASGRWWAPDNLAVLTWIGMATAVGDATRSRRAYVAAVEERARRAEQTREDEARRRVAEERLRIARELHDVVAHHIAVINVQAGAAGHVLHSRPEAVGPALDHIRRASDTVLKELAGVVGYLRQSTDVDAPTEPTRGLARLTDLLDGLAAGGLKVEHRQRGEARELPAVVDLAAYRIVQEALTNAQRYGTGTARLTIAYTPDGVTLDLTNPVAAGGTGNGGGYGIVGMRERAAAAGGTVTAQPSPGGGFAVHAVLPAPGGPVTP